MRDDLEKHLDKNVSNTIKTAIRYPLELDLDKISYVNFYKLTQITKKFIISDRLCFSLRQTSNSTSSTYNNLLIFHRL